MLHLLRLEYLSSERAAEPFAAEHVKFLERHHGEGTFLLSGQTTPTADGGAIIACGVDRATAERIAAEDPLVRADVAKYAITTVTPGRARPSLAEFLEPPERA